MEIIPVINCPDFECVRSKYSLAQEFLTEGGWVHIDIADGGFTEGYSTWRNPEDLKKLKRDPHLKIEVHLMLNEPELAIEEWLEAGVDRIIFHFETTTAIDTVAAMCLERGVEPWLAIGPHTPVEKLLPYLSLVCGCQVLAVHPGLAAQTLELTVFDTISALRKQIPQLPIEVDGGVSLETAPALASAGATQLAAGTAIFGAPDPARMYRELTQTG